MPVFDAICHALSTVSTAGFSTKNTSIGYYNSLSLDVIVAVFMFICACNFSIYYLCFQKEFKKVLKNSELRFFAGLVLMAIVFIALSLYFSKPASFPGGIKNACYSDSGKLLSPCLFPGNNGVLNNGSRLCRF